MSLIFIQIASYRDPELVPTIKDCIAKAKLPDNLRFAICRQYHPDDEFDNVDEYRFDPHFQIIDIPYQKAKGVCVARRALQTLYNDEEYYLQLDSHHRFTRDWDTNLIKQIKSLQRKGHKKPLLTAYLPSYEPGNDPAGRANKPWELKFDRFLPQGPAMPKPETMDDFKKLRSPIQASLYSAHFVFTIGKWCKEVVYDSELYFHGEEISLAIRSYTHGYDLFHPHKIFAWHYYTRKDQPRHWADVDLWEKKNNNSHAKYRRLVGIDSNDTETLTCGLGTERTLEQYIKYSGIDVTKKEVHNKALSGMRLPLKYKSKKEYTTGFCKRVKYCIDLDENAVSEKDYDTWVIAFRDKDGEDIFREDYGTDLIDRVKKSKDKDSSVYNIWVEYSDHRTPIDWLVWPHSKSKGWCDPICMAIPT